MGHQAENQSPEEEFEDESTEQTPEDELQQTENEASDQQSAEQQATEEESEEEFYFGDEKLESPTSEEDKDPALVRHLRNTIKEKERELKELRNKSPQQPQQVQAQAPRMPQMSDEGIDYDEPTFQKKLSEWSEANAKYHSAQAQQHLAQQEAQQRHQQKIQQYHERVKTVKVPDYQQAEKLVIDEVPEQIQAAIIHYAEKPEMIVIALARNPELRKQVAEATDPVALGRLIGTIESKARTMPKPKPTAATPPEVKGTGGVELNNLDKLREQAEKSGNYSAYFAAKRKAKK